MSELVAKLWQQVDPATLAVLVGFWLRWELWTRAHNKKHLELDELVTPKTRRRVHV